MPRATVAPKAFRGSLYLPAVGESSGGLPIIAMAEFAGFRKRIERASLDGVWYTPATEFELLGRERQVPHPTTKRSSAWAAAQAVVDEVEVPCRKVGLTIVDCRLQIADWVGSIYNLQSTIYNRKIDRSADASQARHRL